MSVDMQFAASRVGDRPPMCKSSIFLRKSNIKALRPEYDVQIGPAPGLETGMCDK